jgi:hypothetical protein
MASTLNPGLGFWEHQIQAGATYSIGKPKFWNTSFLTTWKINHGKNGLDVKPGPMLTGDYSFGRRFDKYQMNAGRAGYSYKKLSAIRAVASIHCSPESRITRLRLGNQTSYRLQVQFVCKLHCFHLCHCFTPWSSLYQ